MNLLNIDKSWKDEDNLNWDAIEISKINDNMIKKLINYYLSVPITEAFFISIESLLKLGKKAKSVIESTIIEIDGKKEYKKNILKLILNYIQEEKTDNYLVFKLYNPDFITRARAIMEINQRGVQNYLYYILPLLNDPDDSVRWAVLELLINHDLVKDPSIFSLLKKRLKKELNEVIQKKIREVIR